MSLTDRDLPPHLYGKDRRHDLGLGLVMTASQLFARATALLPIRRMVPPGSPSGLELEVADRTVESADGTGCGVVLRSPEHRQLPAWWPGAHLDVHLPSGRMRTYSLCGDHRDRDHYRIAVRRLDGGGGGSVEAHQVLQLGSRILVRGPRNAFPFAPPGAGSSAPHVHFVAGGIGITPILAMLRLADARGIDWTLTYCGRDRESLPFLPDLAGFRARVEVRLDSEHGVPTTEALLTKVRAGDAVYCCGPEAMIVLVRRGVAALPGTELHLERFTAPPVVGGTPFTIELARSGDLVDVPADVTALDAVRPGRAHIAYLCQQGFCGTCAVDVLHGQPEHRDTILTERQRAEGKMLLCVSRAVAGSRLVIDA